MTDSNTTAIFDAQRTWPEFFASQAFMRAAYVGLFAILIAAAVNGIFLKHNDYRVHRDAYGQMFLDGQNYYKPGPPYPLGRHMFNSVALLFEYRTSRAVVFSLAVVLLALSLNRWRIMANSIYGQVPGLGFAAAALTLVLLVPYIIRDLDDCGLQLILLSFLTFGTWALFHQQSWRAGFWFAMAATWKLLPVMVLPFLIWKRQWLAAVSMVLFLPVINLLAPAAIVGWDSSWQANQRWAGEVVKCFQVSDPSTNPIEPPRHQNQSLPMAISRFLQTYPEGHDLKLDHPLFVQFGSLDPATANRVTKIVLLLLAGVLAFRYRKAWSPDPSRSQAPAELASVCILCALVSQMCWLQHLVLTIPAVYLTMHYQLTHWPGSRIRWVALGGIAVVVLLMGRALVGHDLSVLILSYKFDTWAALTAMTLALTLPTTGRAAVIDVKPDFAIRPAQAA